MGFRYFIYLYLFFAINPATALAANSLTDLSYGAEAKQQLDVYLPDQAKQAPIIVMVHGGAWRFGDKASNAVVDNKVERWVSRGFIFVSVNYRLLPKADPLQQATDVAKALQFVQQHAASWGGDAEQMIVMGHSAGAHLVSMLAASAKLTADAGVPPWLATIAIDSAAYDVVTMMSADPPRFYERAFGNNKAFWQQTSPFHLLTEKRSPFLAICSTRRAISCQQATAFINKAQQFDMTASLLKVDLSHRATNVQLGKNSLYTQDVERFISRLSPALAQRLQ